ncbi:MAG: hypothetical protein AAF415_19950 [Pseudomonadota bacterium]
MTETLLHNAVEALLSELERELENATDLKARLARNEARRSTLITGVKNTFLALPVEARSPFRDRLNAAIGEQRQNAQGRPAHPGRHATILKYLAEHAAKEVKVAQVQKALHQAGHTDAPRGYASFIMAQLAKRYVCRKERMGIYWVNPFSIEILEQR